MNRFADVLEQTSARLELPQPTKSRILLELAADLEDLYRVYRAEGLSESEAIQRAREMLDFSDATLSQLAEVHTAPFRRFLDRLSLQAQTRWERGALMAVFLIILTLSGPQLFTSRFFSHANALAWPLVASSVGALLIALQRIYALYLKRDHQVRRLRAGLTPLIGLAALDLLLGVAGFFIQSHAILGPLLRGATIQLAPSLLGWLIEALALLTMALTAALLTAMLWFLLASKAAAVERAAAAHLVRG